MVARRPGLRERWRRLRSTPEDSTSLRALAFGAQAVSVLSLAYASGLWPVALVAIPLLALGARYAYRVRRKPPRSGRLLVFIAFHLALLWMAVGLVTGQPYPQAQLTIITLSIMSFELFSRLNLYSSFGFALGNLYIAATLSRDLLFLPFLLAFIAFLLAFLWVADGEDGVLGNPIVLEPATPPNGKGRRSWPMPLAWGARLAGAVAVAAPLLFVFSPRYAAIPPVPPVSIRVPVAGGVNSDIVNPAVPLVQIEGWSNQDSDYYPGFNSRLDLSYRGGLDDTVMMYVRSPASSYWRSHGYDVYDGRSWSQGEEAVRRIRGANYFFSLREWPPGEKFAQSFFVVRAMPNLLFTGGDPIDVVVAADSLVVDSMGGLRVGEPLRPGMSYSVLSTPQEFEPGVLRQAANRYPVEISARYLQLPPTVSERTRALARDVTRDRHTAYDKVVALREFLRETYPYDFYPPAQPPGADAVDQFLFVDRRGVCEHYVSAHIVMLRSLGIPARMAAGFGSGDFNPMSGYYTVRANDAHAWTEVFFPGFGWVPFDPTPGWTAAPATGPVNPWIFSRLVGRVDLPRLPIAGAAAAGMAALRAAFRPLQIAVLFIAAVALAWAFFWLWRRRPERRRRGTSEFYRDPRRRRIFAAYRRAQRRLHAPRAPAQTVGEHLREHEQLHPELGVLAEAVDVAAYRPEPPDERMLARIARWLGRPLRQ